MATARRSLRRQALFVAAVFVVAGCTVAETGRPEDEAVNPYGPLDPGRKVLVAGRFKALDLGNHAAGHVAGVNGSTS